MQLPKEWLLWIKNHQKSTAEFKINLKAQRIIFYLEMWAFLFIPTGSFMVQAAYKLTHSTYQEDYSKNRANKWCAEDRIK
ncbi:hypothetical protein SAMN04487907_101241 [Zunongwangia mangrovi]|uniref:Uncharacterized protein n=1 Tax=Zunongwangia mangrovi TaxID=1334022 RepID=A0A1I1DAJ3_9FLAO|nr:hypothetical protein [Zunongwangia mangrovi]SFB71834.1 hypothetical protein SAMN04487907_101241 [Zunongwangia mangrovi]